MYKAVGFCFALLVVATLLISFRELAGGRSPSVAVVVAPVPTTPVDPSVTIQHSRIATLGSLENDHARVSPTVLQRSSETMLSSHSHVSGFEEEALLYSNDDDMSAGRGGVPGGGEYIEKQVKISSEPHATRERGIDLALPRQSSLPNQLSSQAAQAPKLKPAAKPRSRNQEAPNHNNKQEPNGQEPPPLPPSAAAAAVSQAAVDTAASWLAGLHVPRDFNASKSDVDPAAGAATLLEHSAETRDPWFCYATLINARLHLPKVKKTFSLAAVLF
jgi:hypothetical protein